MPWESSLLGRTRLGQYAGCMQLLDAYAEQAPWWERLCLLTYCGLGTCVAECLGVDTGEIWKRGEAVLTEMFAASELPPEKVAGLLREYVGHRLKKSPPLDFESAFSAVYNQAFYPLVQHVNFALQPSAAARMKFVEAAAEGLNQSPASVADLGCGPGYMLGRVLASRPSWHGYGLDISPHAVQYARRVASYKGVGARAEFRIADVRWLPFPDGSIDFVIASEVLEHVPTLESAIKEIARVLCPEGRAAITLPLETSSILHIHSLQSPDHLVRLCRRAGLRILDVKSRRERVGYGDDPGHLFLLAQAGCEVEPRRAVFPLPQAESLAPGRRP